MRQIMNRILTTILKFLRNDTVYLCLILVGFSFTIYSVWTSPAWDVTALKLGLTAFAMVAMVSLMTVELADRHAIWLSNHQREGWRLQDLKERELYAWICHCEAIIMKNNLRPGDKDHEGFLSLAHSELTRLEKEYGPSKVFMRTVTDPVEQQVH